MKKIHYISIVALLLFFVSCGTMNKPSIEASLDEGTSWQLSESVKGNIPTLTMKQGVISGNAGCNTYNAKVEVSRHNGLFLVDQVSTTRMACRNMQAEYSFLSMLKKVNRYKIEDNQLKLYEGKVLLLKFDRK